MLRVWEGTFQPGNLDAKMLDMTPLVQLPSLSAWHFPNAAVDFLSLVLFHVRSALRTGSSPDLSFGYHTARPLLAQSCLLAGWPSPVKLAPN